MRIVTSKIMKKIENYVNENGTSYSYMMEEAGKAVAETIENLKTCDKRVVFLCGKGNNAGDAFVAARHLSNLNYNVDIVLLLGRNFTELSQEKFELIDQNKIKIIDNNFNLFCDFDIVVDAVFGTGFLGDLDENIKCIFKNINNSKATKISLDIPSGIECDNGILSDSHFIADLTLAFGALKPAHILKTSTKFCGSISLIPIGITEDSFLMFDSYQLLDSELAATHLLNRKVDSNKGDFGKLLILGGSSNMPGAVTLASMAALRSGVGLVQTGVPKSIVTSVSSHILETTFITLYENKDGFISQNNIENIDEFQKDKDAILVGMGMGVCEDTILFLSELIKKAEVPLIIDGDGLNCLADDMDILKHKNVPVVLTPHMKEMSRLTNKSIDNLKKDRFDISMAFVKKHNVTLVLKDSNTLITTTDLKQFINCNGNSGMAKGGSGDVLAGVISSLVAQGYNNDQAAKLGVFLHASAGDITAKQLSEYSMLPHDIINNIGNSFKELNIKKL